MRGRGKFEAERLILSAHTGEAMARTKRLRPAEHYLKPPRSAKAPPSAVAQMMTRMEKAGMAVSVRRIPLNERKAYGRNDSRVP
jgi:hypothetical protein